MPVFDRPWPPLPHLLWELPQSTLGAALYALVHLTGRARSVARRERRWLVESPGLAISLGHFVFWCEGTSPFAFLDPATRDHEWGHTFQSRALGPLYLPVVGLASSARVAYAVAYRAATGRRWRGYFDGFPEAQADRLGGVDRAAMKSAWPLD